MVNYEEEIRALELWQSPVEVKPVANIDFYSNTRQYRVIDGDHRYVVHRCTESALHQISHSYQVELFQTAAPLALAPRLVYHHTDVMVIEYQTGVVIQSQPRSDTRMFEMLIDEIKRFHLLMQANFAGVSRLFWVFQICRCYQHQLREANSRYRSELIELDRVASRLEEFVGKIELVFAHNNLQRARCVADDDKIYLLDFQHAGFNSPLFDLASLATAFDFSEDQETMMMDQYYGEAQNGLHWRSYYAMRCALPLLDTLRAMLNETQANAELANVELDFKAHSDRCLEYFERNYAEFRNHFL